MKGITIHIVQDIGWCTVFTGCLPRHSLWTTGTFCPASSGRQSSCIT